MSRRSQTDKDRFDGLYADHYRQVMAYLLRRTRNVVIAEDLAAETFTVVWRRINVVPATEPLPWLYAVARRVMANHRRSSLRQKALMGRIASVYASPSAPPDSTVLDHFSMLSTRDQEVLSLAVWEQLTAPEAAKVLGCTPLAYRLRLHRARTRLRRRLIRDVSGTTNSPPSAKELV